MIGFAFGHVYLGGVEHLDGERICTKFLVVGIPLIPLEGCYCLSRAAMRIEGFPIAVQPKSALVAYVRIWGAFLLFFIALVAREKLLVAPFVVAIALWLFASLFIGRLGARERQRRLMLKRYVGVGAPPRLLPSAMAREGFKRLNDQWRALDNEPGSWRELEPAKVRDRELELYFVLESYAAALEHGDHDARVMSAWSRLATKLEAS